MFFQPYHRIAIVFGSVAALAIASTSMAQPRSACREEPAQAETIDIEVACAAIIADTATTPVVRAWAHLHRGLNRLRTNQLELADEDVTQGLRLVAQTSKQLQARLYRLSGEIHFTLGNQKTAIEAVQASLAADASAIDSYLLLARIHRAYADSDKEFEVHAAVVQRVPKHIHSRLRRAMISADRHQPDVALDETMAVLPLGADALRRVVISDANGRRIDAWSLANSLKAGALGRLSRAPEGQAIMDALVEAAPTHLSHRLRGEFYVYLGSGPNAQIPDNSMRAIRDLQTAARLDPSDDLVWWEIARLLLNEKKFDEALAANAIGHEQSPPMMSRTGDFVWQKAMILRAANRRDEAEKTLTSGWVALSKDDDHISLYQIAVKLQHAGYLRGRIDEPSRLSERQIVGAVRACVQDQRCW